MNSDEVYKKAVEACNRSDHVGALPLFHRAAELGNAEAQYALGLIYVNGRGTSVNYSEAAKWFRRGADQGNLDCLYMLGCCYDEGWGVSKDHIQAYAWLSLAADTGYIRATEELARIEKHMTPTQIAHAKKVAGDIGIEAIIPAGDCRRG